MIQDLNITLILLRERKAKLIEKLKKLDNQEDEKLIMNDIYEIDIKINEYNEKIKKQRLRGKEEEDIGKIKLDKNIEDESKLDNAEKIKKTKKENF